MTYTQVSFDIADDTTREMLIAALAGEGFEGFEEGEHTLHAFINKDEFDKEALDEVVAAFELIYTITDVAQQNWNEQWESSFQPVVVDGFCTVRADFHPSAANTPFEIIITPKMSFGTGHHATTQLMMEQMRHLKFRDAQVLDFGSGTGILAILAEKLGAKNVIAIDNDEWCYENATENVSRNDSRCVVPKIGSLEVVQGQKFDIILANINRHILLAYMADMFRCLNAGGKILMSGLLEEDEQVIVPAATLEGFILKKNTALNNWISLLFNKG